MDSEPSKPSSSTAEQTVEVFDEEEGMEPRTWGLVLAWTGSAGLMIGLVGVLVYGMVQLAGVSTPKPDLDRPTPPPGDPNLPSMQERQQVTNLPKYSQEQAEAKGLVDGQSNTDVPYPFTREDKELLWTMWSWKYFPMRINPTGPRTPFGPSGGSGYGQRGSFFGIGGNAQNICYVIDRSGSMLETFDFVKAELIRSINSLTPIQTFHVVFFNSGVPLENPPAKLVHGTAANKQQVADFLREVVPEGQTNPLKALERAFEVATDKGEKAQLIYFLTDGEIPSETVTHIRKLNPDKKVRINTISYICDDGRSLLETIAKDSGGKFKFLAQEELGK